MSTDGSHVKQITKVRRWTGSRGFSPMLQDLVHPSKKGWVSVRDATTRKVGHLDGETGRSDPVKVVDSAKLGQLARPDEIMLRATTEDSHTKVGSEKEVELVDSAGVSDLGTEPIYSSPRCLATESNMRSPFADRSAKPASGIRQEDLDANRPRLPGELDARRRPAIYW